MMPPHTTRKSIATEVEESREGKLWANDKLRLVLTSHCNINCFYCHNEGRPKSHQFLSSDFITSIIEVIEGTQQFPSAIKFTGGEPLLHPSIAAFLKAFIPICEDRSIVTNGLLLTSDYLKLLKENGLTRIRLGVDSLTNRKSRPSIGKWTAGRRVTEVIEILQKQSVPFEMNVVITKFNLSDLQGLMHFCATNQISAKFIEELNVVSLKEKNQKSRIVSGQQSLGDFFTNIVLSHFPGMRRETDSMGDANILFRASGFHFRFCKHLCDYNLCHTTGTRVDPDGAVYTCMNTRRRYFIDPKRSYSYNQEMLRAALDSPCGQHEKR
jgi:GTP 3',8-cyclase